LDKSKLISDNKEINDERKRERGGGGEREREIERDVCDICYYTSITSMLYFN